MDEAKSLNEKLLDSMELGNDAAERFLPAKSLAQLITEESVKTTLEPIKPLLSDIDMKELVQFVCTKARAVFATLVWCSKEPFILAFYRAGFTDKMLPVSRSGATLVPHNDEYTPAAQATSKDTGWTSVIATQFSDNQWYFISPVFKSSQFHYPLLKKYHMPFLNTSSGDAGRFGEVKKCTIHRDHIDINIGTMCDKNGHPVVAKKELKRLGRWSDDHFKDVAEREANVLKKMREFPHNHLIEVIAYCEISEMERYFLFPWAEDGNLQQYWNEKTPHLDSAYVKWVFSQLTGLAEAIQQLHDPSKGNCQHGDIKPQNILCFKDPGAGITNCRLVIADLGLAKVHVQEAAARDSPTTTKSHTIMYSAPEAHVDGKPRSRVYDVWSIGCTYLEFLIWLLWGKKKLGNFQEDVHASNLGTFYGHDYSLDPPFHLSLPVDKWVGLIRDDRRCSGGTALRRLIDLIVTRLLVVQVSGGAPKTTESLVSSDDTQGPVKVIVCPPAARNINKQGSFRASAKEMHDELLKIRKDIENKRCRIVSDSKSEGEPQRPEKGLSPPSHTARPPGIGTRKVAVR
ncbi:putative protein kinase domain-containing protein [Rosellinia necatrix]|uniref:Protein kinase domain-containing protein n=1 Tax=Rosellinia necatrix TaxID=77044 RepID=A0A1W2TIA3_ROSNE|nr:putative protein kinase domain-containing protein [Rosellinia necatrix]